VVRDFTVACRDEREGHEIAEHVGSLAGVQVLEVTDRTFELHQGGKIEMRGRVPVRGPDDLSMVYTPGVGRVSLAIKDDLSAAALGNLSVDPERAALLALQAVDTTFRADRTWTSLTRRMRCIELCRCFALSSG